MNKNEFNPSEKDMMDAWYIYEMISELKKIESKSEDSTDMIKDLEIGMRLAYSKPEIENSFGNEIIERFYKSWEQKSLMASDIKKKLKNNEIDQIYAYAIAVVQTVVATMPQSDVEKEEFYKKRNKYSKKIAKRNKEIKTDHYYVLVFLTLEKKIYLDYSIRNDENKIVFKRVSANKFYEDPKNNDWDIKVGVGKVVFYLEKAGLEIEDAPNTMITRFREVSENLRIHEIYYFSFTKKASLVRNNDNFGILTYDEFQEDKDIDELEKEMVTKFFNGEGIDSDSYA